MEICEAKDVPNLVSHGPSGNRVRYVPNQRPLRVDARPADPLLLRAALLVLEGHLGGPRAVTLGASSTFVSRRNRFQVL
jgi:hypothetical protein